MADASIGAQIEDYRDVLVVLYAEVADTYVQIRTLQARIVSALGNVRTQQGALQLTVNRNRAGLAPDLDVRQAELNLATTQAFVPTLRAALAQSINRLAVLLGEFPSDVQAELEQSAPIPSPPAEVVLGLPTELLRQRPDIRAAERQLAAQTAQIGVATADLYPSLSLSGAFAFESFSSSDLFQWKSRAFQFGPTVRWNIFDAGRIRNNIVLQDALTEEILASYEQTVLSAVEEVETAMAAYVQEVQRREALQRSVVAARASVVPGGHPLSQRPDRLPERPGHAALAVHAGGRAGGKPGPRHPGPDPALPGAGRRLGPGAGGRLAACGDRHPAGARAPAGAAAADGVASLEQRQNVRHGGGEAEAATDRVQATPALDSFARIRCRLVGRRHQRPVDRHDRQQRVGPVGEDQRGTQEP